MIIEKEYNINTSYLGFGTIQDMVVSTWGGKGDYLNREEYLVYLIERLYDFSIKNEYNLFVLIGDDVFNENNRIVNYYRLWRQLAKKNLVVTDGVYSEEIIIEKDNMVKFFGGIKIVERSSIGEVVKILSEKLTSHLVLLPPNNSNVEMILQSGFSRVLSENKDYISHIIRQGGIVLFREGCFDDRYTGFIGFGNQTNMSIDLFT